MGIPTPPFVEIGTIGFDDSLILLLMALVVFGPRRLPQIGRQLGKLMYEFRKASNDFKFQMEEEMRAADEADRRKQEEARQRQLAQQAQEHVAAAEAADQAQKALPAGSETTGSETAGSETTGFEESYNESAYPYEDYESSYAEPEIQEAQSEEAELRVQPPATGEPVAAERPGSVRGEAETVPEPAPAGGDGADGAASQDSGAGAAGKEAVGTEAFPVEKAAAAAGSGAVTEPAGHHG